MLILEHLETFNWEGATRGMRNAFKSWAKSDSYWKLSSDCSHMDWVYGENDFKLACNLGNAERGSDRKFLTQLIINCDITAPLYWWKEFDTYKVGVRMNSESTMHTLMNRPISMHDFSHEKITTSQALCPVDSDIEIPCKEAMEQLIGTINYYISMYQKTKEKKYFDVVVQMLPSSFNQLRTVTFTYEVARNVWVDRHNHKLLEWRYLCDRFVNDLPYFKELCLRNYPFVKRVDE